MVGHSVVDEQSLLAGLPDAYARWRASRLGRITDALEEALILELMGPIANLDVLDVGCGDGRLALRMVDAGARVSAVDPDSRMLALARDRFGKAGATVHVAEAAAHQLPFDDDSFDRVVAITVLCFLRAPESALNEIARVLRPGGRLLLGELASRSTWAAWRRLRGWLGHPTWRAARFRTPDDLARLARKAGLEPTASRAGIFYPPFGFAAVLFAGLDRWLSDRLVSGGAFIVLAATKPEIAVDDKGRI